jgi:hemerythrin-like domain-containing protein
MTVIAVLAPERDSIKSVVAAMSTVLDHLEQGRRIDASLLTEVIIYLRAFAEHCQEAKEEGLLFPALEGQRVSDPACSVAILTDEHRRIGSLTLELSRSVDVYTTGQFTGGPSLVHTLRALVGLYHEHIQKEDRVLLALTDKIVSEEEENKLLKALQSVESKIDLVDVARNIEQHAGRCLCFSGEILI